jgi:hypothetical protein
MLNSLSSRGAIKQPVIARMASGRVVVGRDKTQVAPRYWPTPD